MTPALRTPRQPSAVCVTPAVKDLWYSLVLGPGSAEPRRVVEALPTPEPRPGPAQVPRSHPQAGDGGPTPRTAGISSSSTGFSMLASASETAHSSDAANLGCFCSSNLRTYSTFSIAWLADFMKSPVQ